MPAILTAVADGVTEGEMGPLRQKFGANMRIRGCFRADGKDT